MKRVSLILSLVALGMVAALVPTTADANCSVPILSFGQVGYQCVGSNYYCYIQSPGVNTIASLDANFWGLGSGDPFTACPSTTGRACGDDEGNLSDSIWLTRFSTAYPIYMARITWGQGFVDGCPSGIFSGTHTTEAMVAMFSDEDVSGNTSYWAAAAFEKIANDPSGGIPTDFNFSRIDTDITLVAAPTIAITGSTATSATTRDVTVSCPNLLASGFYSDGTVGVSEVITGCKVYQFESATAPTGSGSRDSTTGWVSAGSVANASSGIVPVSCTTATSTNVYLAAAVEFDSGFSTQFLGPNTVAVGCGPTHADPDPRFKIIDRKGGGIKPKER